MGWRSRPRPSQQMESIYFPWGTSDLRTFCLLAASKHISQLRRVPAGPSCPPREQPRRSTASPAVWGTDSQADHSSCSDPGGWEQPGSEKRLCGTEQQQICPLPAAVCHFRTMGTEELWLRWGAGGFNKPQGSPFCFFHAFLLWHTTVHFWKKI